MATHSFEFVPVNQISGWKIAEDGDPSI